MKKLILFLLFFSSSLFAQTPQRTNRWDLTSTNSYTSDVFNIANQNVGSHIFVWSIQQGAFVSCTLSFQTSPDNKATSTWTTQQTQDCINQGQTNYLTFVTNFLRVKITSYVVSGAVNPLVTVNYNGYIIPPTTIATITTAPVNNQNINNVRYCNQFSGANFGVKIAACIADLPSTGGTADARGFEGSQSATQNIWAGISNTKPVTLLTGGMTLHSTVTQQVISSNSNWIGLGTSVSFEPTAPFVGGVNDRAIWVSPSNSSILGSFNTDGTSIALGATALVSALSSDVATLVSGDWLLIYQIDAVVGDVVIFDWMQVSSVSGTTVNTLSAFRTAFPSIASGGHSVTAFNVIKAANVLQNINIQGITCTTTDAINAFPCFATGYSRNVKFDHLVSNPKLGNAFYSYRSQGLKITNSDQLNTQTQATEIAESVDFLISNSTFGITGVIPNTVPLVLDLGAAFFSVTGNSIYGCGSICVLFNDGVHDGVFTSNVIAATYTPPNSSRGIVSIGSQRLIVANNILSGGQSASDGITFEDAAPITVDIISQGNVIGPNKITGYTNQTNTRESTDLYIITYGNTSDFEINGGFDCEHFVNHTCLQTHISGEALQRFTITTVGLLTWTDAGVSGTDFTLSRGSSGVAEFSKNLKADGYNISSKSQTTLANGANNDIAITTEITQVVGPTGVFSISGFTGGVDGRKLYIYNSVAFAMTITNEATSTATNRINTLTGADVTLRAGKSFASFIYDGSTSRWLLMSTN